MNYLDRAICAISPQAGAQRMAARAALRHIEATTRSYDAAGTGRRFSNWWATSTSGTAEAAQSARTIRNRHRELVRNNPWAARAVQAVATHTIEHGITGELQLNRKPWEAGTARLREWADSTECDFAGLTDFNGLQNLTMRAVAESGGVLIRKRVDASRAKAGLFPLQLQLLEIDYLDIDKVERSGADESRIINGLQFNKNGKLTHYWLFPEHPGDVLTQGVTSQPVPAGEVLHVYRVDRPGQLIGVPWGAPCMVTLRDLDDYEDAFLFRQKIQNCLTAFVSPSLENKATAPPLSDRMEPGRIEVLPNGSSVAFPSLPSSADYGPYVRDVLMRVAATYGITFQSLTGDLTKVNFTSGRIGQLDEAKNIDSWRWLMLVPQMLSPVGVWFGEIFALLNGVPAPANSITSRWSPPKRELMDPPREVPAAIKAIRAGLTTLPEYHRSMGQRHGEVYTDIKASNDLLDSLDITLDSDPRKVSSAGLAQTTQQVAASPEIDDEGNDGNA